MAAGPARARDSIDVIQRPHAAFKMQLTLSLAVQCQCLGPGPTGTQWLWASLSARPTPGGAGGFQAARDWQQRAGCRRVNDGGPGLGETRASCYRAQCLSESQSVVVAEPWPGLSQRDSDLHVHTSG